ncbi:MAG TPA: flagellar biosynthetic protein FliR [Candidatus Agathobaculum merdigallinarum]|nr:flagellar biosynthetic protein FliR [Candidatus Agathobaculum merdigallinarum]
MIDEAQLTLFLYILMRMTGFVVFNPLWGGRSGVPGMVKAGMSLVLAVAVYSFTPNSAPAVPATALELSVRLLLELALGYVVAMVVHFFFYVVLQAGQLIDAQMGMNMSETYDPSMDTNVSLTGNLLNILMALLFFTAGGHITLLRILLGSGEIIPFGSVSLGTQASTYLLECFASCVVLAFKLSLPILAAELIGELGMGILMKVIPQINVFAINFELKIILGLALVLLMMPLMGEFILGMEKQMLVAIEDAVSVVAG